MPSPPRSGASNRLEAGRRIPRFIFALLLLFAALPAQAGNPSAPVSVRVGRIVDLGILKSNYADPRRVVVWLPPGYSKHGSKCAVLYMHDGQNLFDKATAGYGMSWEVAQHLSKLIETNKVRPAIVVGIWNTPKRLQEYMPQKTFFALPERYRDEIRTLYGGDPLSDGYLKFIVRELRPMIDRRFNVRTDRADTIIMGSSMGALISLYAIDEYPQVFGAAGMMSAHWPLLLKPQGQPIRSDEFEAVASTFERYLAGALPDPATHRLYFDHGDQTLDAMYAPYQARVDAVVAQRGFVRSKNWMSLTFPGQNHSEISWSSRLDTPLQFLLPPSVSH